MKCRVYQPTIIEEKEVFFRLVEGDGQMTLIMCDSKGDWLWDILYITDKGELGRSLSIEIDAIQVDKRGRIKLEGE